ncbi:MAG TPA: GTPase Era [Candidatus Sulfobium mesophilum]|nr:GTPase Era [Candidatus Sulfobium mesophilum]
MQEPFRSGYVSIIGRPNVGKSTLLNAILGQKVSIVAARPQTTRNKILGVKNLPGAQIIFIDTPGIHRPKSLLGAVMVKSARDVLSDIDIVLFVAEAGGDSGRDDIIIQSLKGTDKPVFLLLNKIDRVRKPEILHMIDQYRGLFSFKEIFPVSSLKKDGIDNVVEKLLVYLPEGPRYYPEDIVTDQIERFMAAEIIREKIMGKTSEEIPYSVAVEVQNWAERQDGIVSISANIYVEREGQKGIIIGEKGRMLKEIGTLARIEIERLLDARVFLQLWVKVKKGWRDDKKMLQELGYK